MKTTDGLQASSNRLLGDFAPQYLSFVLMLPQDDEHSAIDRLQLVKATLTACLNIANQGSAPSDHASLAMLMVKSLTLLSSRCGENDLASLSSSIVTMIQARIEYLFDENQGALACQVAVALYKCLITYLPRSDDHLTRQLRTLIKGHEKSFDRKTRLLWQSLR